MKLRAPSRAANPHPAPGSITPARDGAIAPDAEARRGSPGETETPSSAATAVGGSGARPRLGAMLVSTLLFAFAADAGWADEAAILTHLRAAFAEPDRVPVLASAIAADPAWDRNRLSEWLHRTAPYPTLAPGSHQLEVDVGLGVRRRVAIRLPKGYDASRPWPLVYALHPSGGDGPSFLAWVERQLGSEAEHFLLAAPTHYRQTGLDAPPPFTRDHPAILAALRQHLHVDADRVYALGYSLGGYATWAVALLHREELAAAIPLAATLTVPPDHPRGLWRDLLPNLGTLPVLTVWGSHDDFPVLGLGGGEVLGGIGELNRKLRGWLAGEPWAITWREQPGRGHAEVLPSRRDLLAALAHRRAPWSAPLEHTFRHLHQGAAGWLEARSWEGDAWGHTTPDFPVARGETSAEARARVLRPLLGRLHATFGPLPAAPTSPAPPGTANSPGDPTAHGTPPAAATNPLPAGSATTRSGEIEAQEASARPPGHPVTGAALAPDTAAPETAATLLAITTRHVGALTVWLDDGLHRWDRPLVIHRDGREVFRGVVVPRLEVALAEAIRRRDFDRLRWAKVELAGTTTPSAAAGPSPGALD
jgi:hypothetical protein